MKEEILDTLISEDSRRERERKRRNDERRRLEIVKVKTNERNTK